MIRQIPNLFTLLNAFCGCCALVSILNGRYTEGVIFLMVCLAADFFDGFAARLLHVKSEMGKELDSLADMVSFGVVPAVILYKLITTASISSVLTSRFSNSFEDYLPYLAFIITAFSAYRLAKFNLDTRQTENFIGLNTPTNTMFFIGLLLIKINNYDGLDTLVHNTTFLYLLIPVSSFLLISEFPMFSIKMKNFTWKGNELRIIFAIISVILLALMREAAVSVLVIIYVLLNICGNLFFKTPPQ